MNRFQLSWWHLSRQHLSWRHLSISAISQLLITWFWPNFKGRFLGPSWTDSNYHGDICRGNIFHGDICPYQEYISCYWQNFQQTFWDYFLGALILLDHNFVPPKFFWTEQFFRPKLLENSIFDLTFFWPVIFLDQHFLLIQFFGTKMFVSRNTDGQKNLEDKIFLNW